MRILCLGFLALLCPLFGQNASVVTRAGYTVPEPIKVAPGQVITLFVRTAAIKLTDAMVADSSSALPLQLGGLSVALRQTFSGDPIGIPILAVYPINRCAPVSLPFTCTSLTAITVQIPFELVPNVDRGRMPENFATLTVSENANPGDPLPLEAVPDNIHVVNSCDATLPAASQPCQPVIMHADGTVVESKNPATADEILTLNAYGLGRTATKVSTGELSPTPASTVSEMKLGLAFGANGSPARPNDDSSPLSAVLAPSRVGLYSITFKVPSIPSDLPVCDDSVQSNLTVSVARGSSYDGASICVK
jgi:uncharacterized protein (TIGR03437 family)